MDSINNVGQIRELELFALAARHLISILIIELFEVCLWEGLERGAGVGCGHAIGSLTLAEASRDTIHEHIVELNRPEELVEHWMPLQISSKTGLIPTTE